MKPELGIGMEMIGDQVRMRKPMRSGRVMRNRISHLEEEMVKLVRSKWVIRNKENHLEGKIKEGRRNLLMDFGEDARMLFTPMSIVACVERKVNRKTLGVLVGRGPVDLTDGKEFRDVLERNNGGGNHAGFNS